MKRLALAACVVIALMISAVPAQARTICFKWSDGRRVCLVIPGRYAPKPVIHDGGGWQV